METFESSKLLHDLVPVGNPLTRLPLGSRWRETLVPTEPAAAIASLCPRRYSWVSHMDVQT